MMKHEMRRKDRELSAADAKEIFQNGKFGVLSVMGDDGYPYGIPLHYIVIEDNLYFHSTAAGGYKISCLERNPKISFTVIETEDGVKCRSAILFGTAVSVPAMRTCVLEKLVEKFVPPAAWEKAKGGIPFAKDAICAYKLEIESLTAKMIDKPAGK